MNGELRREDPPETRGRKQGTLPRNLVTVRILDRLPALRRERLTWFAVWDFPGLGAAAQWRKNHAHRQHFRDFEFKTVSRHDGSTVYARYVGPPVEVPDEPDDDRPLGPDHPAYRRRSE